MSNTAKVIIGSLLGVLTAYLLAAFVSWDFNAGNWELGGRVFAVFLGFICSLLGGIIANEEI